METSADRQARPADLGDSSPPDTSAASGCPRCPGAARRDRPPTLMGGTGIVEVQRWRCDRDASHWWDDFRPIVDLPSEGLADRRSTHLLETWPPYARPPFRC